MATECCDECGFEIAGGRAGCKAHFNNFTARDFSDPLYFRSHRLFVDAYCLQHPEDYCRSSKSLAAHLAGLCAILEKGASPATGMAQLHAWLDGDRQIEKPRLPEMRGARTVGDLPLQATPEQWSDAVIAWARAVWDAYHALQPQARAWLEAASQPRRR
jgi:hypothetical protein